MICWARGGLDRVWAGCVEAEKRVEYDRAGPRQGEGDVLHAVRHPSPHLLTVYIVRGGGVARHVEEHVCVHVELRDILCRDIHILIP